MRALKFVSLALFVSAAAAAFASLNSAIIVLPTETGRSAPAVSLVLPADYLCAIVTLRTTSKDPDRQSVAMRESLQRVTTAVEKSARFQLHQGAIRFAGTNSSLYASKSSAGSAATLQTSFRVLCPLQGTFDVFEAMKQLRRFIGSLTPVDDTELNIASISLAVAAPEQYRERLLALIAEQSRAIQQNFGARTIIIDGLQNQVAVRQVDESNVELYLDYQLSANLEMR